MPVILKMGFNSRSSKIFSPVTSTYIPFYMDGNTFEDMNSKQVHMKMFLSASSNRDISPAES